MKDIPFRSLALAALGISMLASAVSIVDWHRTSTNYHTASRALSLALITSARENVQESHSHAVSIIEEARRIESTVPCDSRVTLSKVIEIYTTKLETLSNAESMLDGLQTEAVQQTREDQIDALGGRAILMQKVYLPDGPEFRKAFELLQHLRGSAPISCQSG